MSQHERNERGRFSQTNHLLEARIVALVEILHDKGPMTTKDVQEMWAIGPSQAYKVIRAALDRRYIAVVAHVHGRAMPLAVYDIAATEDIAGIRASRYLSGRFCTRRHGIGMKVFGRASR